MLKSSKFGIIVVLSKIKEYFRWVKDDPKKAYYEWSEVKESMKIRREKRFQNLCLDVYYWLYRHFEWLWKPRIIKRLIERFWQKITRGWDDSECWSLDYTIAKFTLPRLIRLKEVMHGYPSAFADLGDIEANKKWNEILDKMIFAMDYIANEREWNYYPDDRDENRDYSRLFEAENKVQEGCELFGKYFRNLWD